MNLDSGDLKPLRIAMVGVKGIPALHGGIERHVDEIARRLVQRGHAVDVFLRPYHPYRQPYYEGVRLRRRPALVSKHLDAASHTALCVAESIFSHRYDVLHVHGIGPGLFLRWSPARLKTVFTYHAQDWRQQKWGRVAKWSLRLGERTALRHADEVIAVSHLLEHYIVEEYDRHCHYIPNGANIHGPAATDLLAQWKLEPNRYLLFVGRILADRGVETLIDAYQSVPGEHQLVFVGDIHLEPSKFTALKQKADSRVHFLGYRSGEELHQLYAHAYFCVHPSEVEGLPIAVLEGMSYGKAVVVSDIPENLEAIEDCGISFPVGNAETLAQSLESLLLQPARVKELGSRAQVRVGRHYDWDRITAATEGVYRASRPAAKLAGGK